MKKFSASIVAFCLFFLFFIQMAGVLVESIYILDLMNTHLDAKALGVLFFFSPLLLLLYKRKSFDWMPWFVFGLLFLSRGVIPQVNTLGRLIAAGLGTGSGLLLFPFLMTSRMKGEQDTPRWLTASAGLALAIALSDLLRTWNYSLDISLTREGSWIGWGLGLLFGWALTQLDWNGEPEARPAQRQVGASVLGMFLILTLTYFAFSAPDVIARWTQDSYVLIVTIVSLLSVGWMFLVMDKPDLIEKVSPRVLLLWNLIFTLSLTGTILAHRVSFPLTADSAAVVVGTPTWRSQIPLVLMLVSFPVLFLDLQVFARTLQTANPAPPQFVPGMLLGSLTLVVLVFISIFTNVWGYVAPVSTPFRNQFHLPYLLLTGALTFLIWRSQPTALNPPQGLNLPVPWGWSVLLIAIFIGTGMFAWRTQRVQPGETNKTSLVVMTYNIQQANDGFGERSYERQLALIQQVSPDILALQESDSARLALNNNDYVRYYAGKLGYYSYYGPTTVSGTFGTSILSKYPLQNPRAVFTFSDVDEIGAAEAEIAVADRTFTIYDVHPDGSDTAMLAFARNLIERSHDQTNVIALGDYNLRQDEAAYQLIAGVYTNAWTSVYPSGIGADGTDMSGVNRIDHIFFSPTLKARDPVYVLPPTSASDHPTHWTEIYWGE